MSEHVPLTPRIGAGLFSLVVCSILGSNARLIYIIFVSVADTIHVYLLSHMFWNFLVHGRSVGLIILLKLKWSVSPPPRLLNTNGQFVRRQLMVNPTLFLP
jgi:hypothetical protein